MVLQVARVLGGVKTRGSGQRAKTRGGGQRAITRGGGQRAMTRGGGQRAATGEQEVGTDGETMLGVSEQ